jgi:hypothetical protein
LIFQIVSDFEVVSVLDGSKTELVSLFDRHRVPLKGFIVF